MTFGGSSFNYFFQNQLTKFSTCSLNNKRKQGQRNKVKSGGTNNLQAKRAEKIELLYAKSSQ